MRVWIWVCAAASACTCSEPAPPPPSCVELYKAEQWDAARARCSDELAVREDPTTRISLARSFQYLGRCEEAQRVARPLIGGPREADAELVLGSCARMLGELDAAARHLERASSMHGAAGKFDAQARDAQQLSGVRFEQGKYRLALEALRVSSEAAERAKDHRMRVYIDLAETQIHRAMGDQRSALAAVARAHARAKNPSDRASVLFRQGTVQVDDPLYAGLAEATFERFLAEERRAPTQLPEYLSAALVNLAFIDHRAGKHARALQRMEEAQRLGLDEMTLRLNRGLILADLGRLREAISDLKAAEAAAPTGEWSWWAPYRLALAHEQAGDLGSSIEASQRSIQKVTEIAAQSGTYGPVVIANLRRPHLHLIGLHARAGRWGEVLQVVTTLDARGLLDSRAAPTDLVPSPAPAAMRPTPPRRALGDARTVLEAWRDRRLVVVVPGGKRVWRLVLRDGVLEGRDLGDAAPFEKLAQELEADPDAAAAGRVLGEAMLAGLPPGRPIDLLVVGQLARAPLVSLRLGDRLAIATLRLVRIPGVLPWKDRPGTPPGPARVLVFGDPNRNLPASAEEARRIAARLGVTPYLHAAARRAVFETSSGAALVHLSAHTVEDLDGPALVLADGRVTIEDIARLSPGPRRVMLASCAASAGRDEAGTGSIANAFLDAGADHVLSTRWTVRDEDAARLVAAFYEAGGDRDPVQGLAEAQLRLAGRLDKLTWASFEVIAGRPTAP